jgi:hypothetical protein
MSYVQIQQGGSANNKHAKYVHFAWNKWDARRRRSVQRRFYIGRLTANGEVILSKRFAGDHEVRIPLEQIHERAGERRTFELWLRGMGGGFAETGGVARVDIVGDAWLIRHCAEASGLEAALTEIFGEADGGGLCGLAAHQFATGHALYRAECWLAQRELPPTWRSALVAESSVHGFVARMGADLARREAFLEHWTGRHQGGEAVLYDTTSLSTYSPSLELAEWGYNRDDEQLPQVNFSLAVAPDGTPLFYRVLPGSIPDVRTLAATLRIARDYGLERLCLSLDRGYYSAANLRDLLGLGCGLIMGAPWSVGQAMALFRRHRARLASPRRAFLYRGMPLRHIRDVWRHEDVELGAHLFYDPARHAEISLRVEKLVLGLAEKAARERFRTWREAKAWIAENAGARAPCLRVTSESDGTLRVAPKPNRIAATTARAGYTLVLTHHRDPPQDAAEPVLRDYRARDMAEKLFDAFKTEHGQYRLRTASNESVQGRFLLGFITLVIRAELEKRMHAAGLHKSMTDAAVLDELGKAKALITRKGSRVLLEVSKRQRLLLEALHIPALAWLP